MIGNKVVVGLPAETIEQSDDLLEVAAVLAIQRQLTIKLVHTVHRVRHVDEGADLYIEQNLQSARRLLQAAANRLTSKIGYSAKIETATSTLPPADALLDEARTASLLLVHRRGLSRSNRILHGSISATVAAQAPCPVMVIPPFRDVPPADLPVVVGVSPAATSDAAVGLAFAESSWRRVPLLAVHAWNVPGGWSTYGWDALNETDVQELRMAAVIGLAEAMSGHTERYPDVEVHRRIVLGPVLDALIDHAARAQLLVTGRQNHTHRTGIGSTTRRLFDAAVCPIVVVPQRAVSPGRQGRDLAAAR